MYGPPVVTAACVLSAGGPWVQALHPAFPAPSLFAEGDVSQSSGYSGRETVESHPLLDHVERREMPPLFRRLQARARGPLVGILPYLVLAGSHGRLGALRDLRKLDFLIHDRSPRVSGLRLPR